MASDEFYHLDPQHTHPARIKKERERARALKQSPWWKEKLRAGLCHYCGNHFPAALLTMDHIVPVARGGESVKTNLVTACKECNAKKRLHTPVDLLLEQIQAEKK